MRKPRGGQVRASETTGLGANGLSSPETPDAVPVTVVIVTWNSEQYIAQCLKALHEDIESGLAEVIVVDNASSDDTAQVARSIAGKTAVIQLSTNLGFAGACNVGIARAHGEHILLLNPDSVIESGSLGVLIRHLGENPRVGICGPLLLDATGAIQRTCGRRLPNLSYALFHEGFRLGQQTPQTGAFSRLVGRMVYPYTYDQVTKVEAVSGAALLIRRSVLNLIGFLDPQFLHCGEDVDLCARTRAAGWEIELVPQAAVWHIGAASSSQAETRTTIEALYGLERYYRKNSGAMAAIAFRIILLTVRLPIAASWALLRLICDRDLPAFRRRRAIIGAIPRLRVRSCQFGPFGDTV